MKRDILFWSKYVGGATPEAAELAKKHFEKLGLKVKVLRGPLETELAKLFETIYRAWRARINYWKGRGVNRRFIAQENLPGRNIGFHSL